MGCDVAKGISSQMNVFHAGASVQCLGYLANKTHRRKRKREQHLFSSVLFSSAAYHDVFLCVYGTLCPGVTLYGSLSHYNSPVFSLYLVLFGRLVLNTRNHCVATSPLARRQAGQTSSCLFVCLLLFWSHVFLCFLT